MNLLEVLGVYAALVVFGNCLTFVFYLVCGVFLIWTKESRVTLLKIWKIPYWTFIITTFPFRLILFLFGKAKISRFGEYDRDSNGNIKKNEHNDRMLRSTFDEMTRR